MANKIVEAERYFELDGQLCEIKRQLRQKNGYPFDADRLKLALQAIIKGEFDKVVAIPENSIAADLYTVVVDYSQPLAEMIKSGNYNWINNYITAKHFPVIGNGKAEVALQIAHFNRPISSDNAIAELDKCGLCPATLLELLAFGAKYPELQRQFPIIALGSVWAHLRGDRYVAYLREDDGKRYLYLRWYGSDWRAHCRFLAVPK